MNILKKGLSASLALLLIASVLTGCPVKEESSPNKAIKDAYAQLSKMSYNFDGYIQADVREDENALIANQDNLTIEQAKKESNIYKQLKSADGQNVLAILDNGKITFKGAVDNKNIKYEASFGINYEMLGIKISFELPIQITLKDNPTIYIDTKADRLFGILPKQIKNKLVRLTLNDLPIENQDDKEKIKSKIKVVNSKIETYQDIIYSLVQHIDDALFKDIAISNEAKEAGAVRVVQAIISPQHNEKITNEMIEKLLKEITTDFNLSLDQITSSKQIIENANNEVRPFTGDTVTNWGLNDKGQIVYLSSKQSITRAKHTAQVTIVSTIKDYDNPTFTIDPTKQDSISIMDIMTPGLLGFN